MGKKIFLGGVNKVKGPRTLSAQSNLSQRDSNMQVRFYLKVVLEYWDVDIFGILHQLLWYIHSAPLYWTKYSLRARLLCTLIVHWPCKFIMLYKHTAARPRAKNSHTLFGLDSKAQHNWDNYSEEDDPIWFKSRYSQINFKTLEKSSRYLLFWSIRLLSCLY